MHVLTVGTNKSDLLSQLPDTYLFIDDGSLIERITIPPGQKVTRLHLSTHSFNPLEDMNYRRAREFIAVLNALFPEGEDTLTRKTSNFVLLKALLAKPKSLNKLGLYPASEKDTGTIDALQKVETLLLSPVLKRFLCNPAHHTNFALDGIILADLSGLDDFEARAIANFLIINYGHAVVVPDFGRYACPFHVSLIRQGRLSAGVHHLNEVPWLKDTLHLFERICPRTCSEDDADTLMTYCAPRGTRRATDGYDTYIKEAMA